jgi:hypothetical protein
MSYKTYVEEMWEIVCEEWIRTASIRLNIFIDDLSLCPFIFHGIIDITDVPRKSNEGS